MLQSEYFENLPEEIQSDIFFRSNLFDISKGHYEYMTEQRELACERSISSNEIKKNIINRTISTSVTSPELLVPDGNSISVAPGRSVSTELGSILIDFDILGIGVGLIRPRLKKYTVADEGIVISSISGFGQTTTVPYSDLLLTPQGAMKVLTNRGELCTKHIKSNTLTYIDDTYDRLYNQNKLRLLEWLMICVSTFDGSDWLPNNAVRRQVVFTIRLSGKEMDDLIENLFYRLVEYWMINL